MGVMRTLSAALLALLAACATDDTTTQTTQPSAEDYNHVASSIAATVSHDGGEVAAMREAVALAHDQDTAGFVHTPDGAFVGTLSDLTYRYDITCAATGTSNLVPCDPATTGAAVTATWTGTTGVDAIDLTLLHDVNWQLTRMVGPIAHIDGTGHVDYQTQGFGSIASYAYDVTYHVIVDDVRAIGGSMHLTITGTHAGPSRAPYTITADLTFSPDDTADLTLDGTHHYQLALATGQVSPK